MSMSTGYVRTHIYIEDMRTKKALSAWIPLVSVFCGSGAASGIRGKQMTPAVASERSIFSKNHDYNTYIKIFPCRGENVRTYISGYKARSHCTLNAHSIRFNAHWFAFTLSRRECALSQSGLKPVWLNPLREVV